jgi:CheY-like chemotaxis protein
MKKMLIVEDDYLSVIVMQRLFRPHFEIFLADSAEKFFEIFNNNIFDIIIMDISLKGSKSGLDIIKEIKANEHYPGTPVLCLTAHAHKQIKQNAIEAGTDFFLTKPVSNIVLMEAVDSLVNKGSKILQE